MVEIGAASELFTVKASEFRGRVAAGRAGQALTFPAGWFLHARAMPDDRASDRKAVCVSFLHITPARVLLVARGAFHDELAEVRFELNSSGGQAVQLSVMPLLESGQPDDLRAATRISEASMGDLLSRHAREARLYLSPILRCLAGVDPLAPGATDVYRVFAEVAPRSGAVESLEALLPQLDDPDPRRREAAMVEVESLGPPGVCAALRMDRQTLSPQQVMSIDSLLWRHSRRGGTGIDVATLRADPVFLIDCFEFPDSQVRAAARDELVRRLKREIPLDEDELIERRTSAIDALRAEALRASP
jgi:hypothetical protein